MSSESKEQSRIKYLRTLKSVRETTSKLLHNPSHLQNFTLHIDKLPTVIDSVIDLIKRDYKSPQDVPEHSRWRHFEVAPPPSKTPVKRIEKLIEVWESEGGISRLEAVRKLVDLFVVSVLLDAGAGDLWSYKPDLENLRLLCGEGFVDNVRYGRSEGLALASLDWFLEGGFCGVADDMKKGKFDCHRVDSKGLLEKVDVKSLERVFQVSEGNPLVGASGRCELLKRLGTVCESFPQFFGSDLVVAKDGGEVKPLKQVYRPGYMVDYLLSVGKVKDGGKTVVVPVEEIWRVVMDGISGVWPPTRTKLGGVYLGDVWPCKAMKSIMMSEGKGENTVAPELVAFHKLSQWLSYSLMEPLALVGIEFEGIEEMTGLAEYRNGGVFVDFGVLELKEEVRVVGLKNANGGEVPRFEVFDDIVVEWRALTVGLLDLVGRGVRERFGMSERELPLVKVLEAGTWKLGREIAAKLRPKTKGPPIQIVSDGTVF
ncbi:hypothetical protein HDU76_001874 [Blyttiomyces sp. JEL0837]|nr:hypothetical protein HDU76_001874 [Blyttiomyces sp. JEL0837]